MRERVTLKNAANSASTLYPPDTVCACLDETGERKVRVVERCERCGACMESDALEVAEARVRELEEALAWIAGNTTEAHIHHSAAALVPAKEETDE